MQLFGFNKKVPGEEDSTITPIVSSRKDTANCRPERFYTIQLKNQAMMMKKSALNLWGQRSLAKEAESRNSNLDETDSSQRNKPIDARESSSRFRAAELSVLYELNDKDEHTTLNPIAIMPTKNAGPSFRSKIPQLKLKHMDPANIMPNESNENSPDVISQKSLNGISRRRSFEITKQIRNNLGRSQRNLSTSRVHAEEFDTNVECRDDTDDRFHTFLHRDRTMSESACIPQTEDNHDDSQRILPAISQDLPDLC